MPLVGAIAAPLIGEAVGGGVLGTIAGGIGGAALSSAFGSGSTAVSSTAQNATDPFAPYRASAASQLNSLMSNYYSGNFNPTNDAGFMAQLNYGNTNASRALASQGLFNSGAQATALQQLGTSQYNQYFNNQFSQLATLAGANQSPYYGGNAGLQAGQAAQNSQMQTLGGIYSALQNNTGSTFLNSLFGGSSGGGTNFMSASGLTGNQSAVDFMSTSNGLGNLFSTIGSVF